MDLRDRELLISVYDCISDAYKILETDRTDFLRTIAASFRAVRDQLGTLCMDDCYVAGHREHFQALLAGSLEVTACLLDSLAFQAAAGDVTWRYPGVDTEGIQLASQYLRDICWDSLDSVEKRLRSWWASVRGYGVFAPRPKEELATVRLSELR